MPPPPPRQTIIAAFTLNTLVLLRRVHVVAGPRSPRAVVEALSDGSAPYEACCECPPAWPADWRSQAARPQQVPSPAQDSGQVAEPLDGALGEGSRPPSLSSMLVIGEREADQAGEGATSLVGAV